MHTCDSFCSNPTPGFITVKVSVMCQLGWSTVPSYSISTKLGTSLVAQWLRIRLPMQGTQVRALVQEDSTCGVTKPVCHNY